MNADDPVEAHRIKHQRVEVFQATLFRKSVLGDAVKGAERKDGSLQFGTGRPGSENMASWLVSGVFWTNGGLGSEKKKGREGWN